MTKDVTPISAKQGVRLLRDAPAYVTFPAVQETLQHWETGTRMVPASAVHIRPYGDQTMLFVTGEDKGTLLKADFNTVAAHLRSGVDHIDLTDLYDTETQPFCTLILEGRMLGTIENPTKVHQIELHDIDLNSIVGTTKDMVYLDLKSRPVYPKNKDGNTGIALVFDKDSLVSLLNTAMRADVVRIDTTGKKNPRITYCRKSLRPPSLTYTKKL